MSDTPRTDAQEFFPVDEHGHFPPYPTVSSALCRDIERELATDRTRLADWQVLTATLEQELSAERALADRLAALLQRDRDGYGGQLVDPECDCCDCEYLAPIDEALAAWKAARTTPTDDRATETTK